MSLDRYQPGDIEPRWYDRWVKANLFAPSSEKGREPFCIVIPPPNVTGSLHMGHAWDNTIQDILIRWQRMEGSNTLWIPGTDHAGIATQWMVERSLREKGLTKEDLGREKFLEEVWKFKEESHGKIIGQLTCLGVSCDWSRERFTLDEGLSRAVRKVFVKLHAEGLIYRDFRMVNWSPGLLSAISDLEVEYKDVQGSLWHFRYPLADGSDHVVVATTRPETMLGDTAVAVNPDDERYRGLVGRMVRLPLAERDIPIIADEYVDPEFGSGAVKITPGHDPNDFEIGKRHKLKIITVMNEDASMNDEVPPPYRGLDRFAARKKVVADLEARNLLEKVEKHQHAVGFCSRSGQTVEPRVSTQWFVDVQALAEQAVKAVQTKQIELLPDFQEKIFYEWMNNIQDWCISRQLWWGHRIPVWYCQSCREVIVSEHDVTTCPACGSHQLEMDTDVLDTWFSSGLWPFSTMGWPEETDDLKTFYPTAVLVTGYDILFFWVARMAMLGLKFMGREPFRQVLLHGLLRDQFGEKMSKTKGNGLDPLDMIEKYGADALRYTLSAGTVLGRDMVLQESAIEGNRNFINKVWNATRYLQGHVEKLGPPARLEQVAPGRFDSWILGRLGQTAKEIRSYLHQRRFNEACRVLYAFTWHEFCDWYVEISKPVLSGTLGPEPQKAALATLRYTLDQVLRLLHPFMPFVTEELWAALPGNEGYLMVQPYPGAPGGMPLTEETPAGLEQAATLIDLVQTVRTVRGENGIKPRVLLEATIAAGSELQALIREEEQTILTLAGLENITLVESFDQREGYGHGVGDGYEVFLLLAGAVDVDAEKQRIGREIEKTRSRITQLSAKLDNPAFIDKAPRQVIEKNREELGALQTQLAKLTDSLQQLSGG